MGDSDTTVDSGMKRSADDVFSPNSRNTHQPAPKGFKPNSPDEVADRKGYNIVIFKDTLEEISNEEFENIQETLIDYQLANNIRLNINKNFIDPINRSLTIRVQSEFDITKITDAISLLPIIAGSSIRYYLPHEELPTNRCYLYIIPKFKKYALKATILKMITLSTDLNESDISLFAPAKTLRDNRIMLPLKLSSAGMEYFSNEEVRWRIFLLGKTFHLRVSTSRTSNLDDDSVLITEPANGPPSLTTETQLELDPSLQNNDTTGIEPLSTE